MISKKNLVKLGLLFLIPIVLGLLFYGYLVFDECRINQKYKETFELAKQIVASIEKYNQENGKYPQSLEDLIPEYIDGIKPPTWGNSGWVYGLEPQGFYFCIGYGKIKDDPILDLYPIIFYDYSGKYWIEDS